MKNLIKYNDIFYLSDDINTLNGKTKKISGNYKITKGNYPHEKYKTNIVMYGRYKCPYCINTVAFLKSKPSLYEKLIYVEVDMETEPMLKKEVILENIKSDIGDHTTVPMVFDKGLFVGGFTETKSYFSKI